MSINPFYKLKIKIFIIFDCISAKTCLQLCKIPSVKKTIYFYEFHKFKCFNITNYFIKYIKCCLFLINWFYYPWDNIVVISVFFIFNLLINLFIFCNFFVDQLILKKKINELTIRLKTLEKETEALIDKLPMKKIKKSYHITIEYQNQMIKIKFILKTRSNNLF